MYTKENPSSEFIKLKKYYKKIHSEGSLHGDNKRKNPDETYNGKSTIKFVKIIKRIIDRNNYKTLLDYGSGKGEFYNESFTDGKERFPPIKEYLDINPTLYDPGIEQFAKPKNKKFDIVISIDVLEHIPSQDLFWVLNEIFSFSKDAVFINIACYPAGVKFDDGRNVHVSLFSPIWWHGYISAISENYNLKIFLVCSYFKNNKLDHLFFGINDKFDNYK